jgi:tetratricopeptide (TPR) repeat protein
MTREEAKALVLQHLRARSKEKNSELVRLLDGNQDLFEFVKEDLIFHGFAEDYRSVGLRYCNSVENPTEFGIKPVVEVAGDILTTRAQRSFRVFLSYGHDEYSELAMRIKERLEERGHEVWFDLSRLKSGQDWERYIEDGLDWVSADDDVGRMIVIMTPHSVRRDEGYCIKELTRAVDRKIRIIPVMAVWVEPPLSICNIQWLDMRDCFPLQHCSARFSERFPRLVDALENGVDLEGAQSILMSRLEPLPFDAEMALHQSRFTGREWLFTKIRAWLNTPNQSRVLCITGAPGVGKTALATVLFNNFREISAVHLCRHNHDMKSDPRRLVKSIAYQLSTQLPDYSARLTSLRDLNVLTRRDCNAETLFDRLIVQPLHGGFPNPDRTIVILIDAIDEASKNGSNELMEFLQREFARTPEWMRLIVTSRPEPEVLTLLQHLAPEEIKAESEENLRDLRRFLERELKRFASGGVISESALDKIVGCSEGIFLYAECVRQALEDGYLSLDRVEDLPRDLNGYYRQFFLRRFPDKALYEAQHRPLIAALIAAREYLTIDYLSEIFRWSEQERGNRPNALGSLFPCEQGAMRPFHRTLAEWLTKRNSDTNISDCGDDYFVGLEQGNAILSDKGWFEYLSGIEEMSPYAQRHLPTHLVGAGRWNDVTRLLSDLEYFSVAWSHDENTVRSVWVQVENNSSFTMLDAYRESIKEPTFGVQSLMCLADLLHSRGHLEKAAEILERCVSQCHKQTDLSLLQSCLQQLGHIQMDLGFSHAAMESYKEAERICRETRNWTGLQAAIGSLGRVLHRDGNLDDALTLYEDQEKICRDIGREDCLASSLNNQGLILRERGDLDEALALYREQEDICRKWGLQDDLQTCLGNRADILADRDDFEGALALYTEQENLCRKFGFYEGLQRCLGNQAMLLRQYGRFKKALQLVIKKEEICRELNFPESLSYALGMRGTILLDIGEYEEALALFQLQEQICLKGNFKRGLQWAVSNQGEALRRVGNISEALSLFRKQELICRAMDSKDSLHSCLESQASLLRDTGHLGEALVLLEEQELICRKLRIPRELVTNLVSQAEILAGNRGQESRVHQMLNESQQIAQLHNYTKLLERIAKITGC